MAATLIPTKFNEEYVSINLEEHTHKIFNFFVVLCLHVSRFIFIWWDASENMSWMVGDYFLFRVLGVLNFLEHPNITFQNLMK
jgi:hypothetical protein